MKNKEITIYELLGLIKDGKAPKTIRYEDTRYNYHKGFKDYYIFGETYKGLFESNKITRIMNHTIEILDEENDEFEDIEEFKLESEDGKTFYIKKDDYECSLLVQSKFIIEKLNDVIRNQKKIIERLNKDE